MKLQTARELLRGTEHDERTTTVRLTCRGLHLGLKAKPQPVELVGRRETAVFLES